MNRKTASSWFVLTLLSKYKKSIIFVFLAAAGTSLADVFATQFIGNAVDYMIGKGQVVFAKVIYTIAILAVLYIIGAFSSWLVFTLSTRISNTLICDLREDVFHKLGKLPLCFFDQTPHGDIISRFTNDLDTVNDALSLSFVNLFTGIVTIIAVLSMMLYHSLPLTLVVLCITPLNFLIVGIITHISQKKFEKQQAIVGELSGFITEMVGNEKVVQALGYEQRCYERFEEKNSVLKSIGQKAHFSSAMINPSIRVVDHLSYILVGVIGSILIISGRPLSIGVISMFLIFSTQFAKPFNDLSGIMVNLQTAMASLGRIQDVIYAREEKPDLPTAKELIQPNGEVVFADVDFSYNKERPLIENLNIIAKPGDTVAIVGPTGAGKTTIVNLLMRFYEIDNGAINIDGTNILDYSRDSLRRSFGMVLQETWLFHGTIAENIAYGKPNATMEEIQQAAKFAHADQFIQQLPQGYKTYVTEDGDNLSQGQKQLLTIARVMLTDPALLILDEATSSIDSLTEIRVQKAFLALMQGRTSFVIAHRLSTIVNANTILVLNKGHIIESGTHKTLLKNKGFYYSLYQSQFE